jgi:hypothetical protein
MKHTTRLLIISMLALVAYLRMPGPTAHGESSLAHAIPGGAARQVSVSQIDRGRQIFRFSTFGSERFWGETLKLHAAIETMTPNQALALGLKVDVKALPHSLVAALKAGQVNLNDPVVTLRLLKLDAVVGIKGFFDTEGDLTSIGIRCALCHTAVNDSLAPGIGRRLDLWSNQDLNIGAIIAMAPNLQPFVDLLKIVDPTITVAAVREVLNSWGPGKFDAELILDGKAVNPNTGESGATLIPPAFGLAGVNLHTWTGWGSATHWNALVANLEMHGLGTFFDPRLDDPVQFPIAAAQGFGNVRNTPDRTTRKLATLHVFQLATPAPRPPAGSFDPASAARGEVLFKGKADCARCHVPPLFTEPGWNLHTPAEIGVDSFQADRSPDRRYRTASLRGLWTHTKRGFFHDGRFADLRSVINHYNDLFSLELTVAEKKDLEEYLRSL